METPPPLGDPSRATRRSRIALAIYGIIGIPLVLVYVGAIMWGWWPDSPTNFPGFGATPKGCRQTYGEPVPGSFAKPQVSPCSLWYKTGGWYVLVGFDEHNRAEQFIFCKAEHPFGESPIITDAQQSRLLEKLKQGSAWNLYQTSAEGSQWNRKDDQAVAYYVVSSRWMIFMNQAGWDRFQASLKADSK